MVPVVDGRLQYACARYGPDAIERAEAALRAGERSLRAASRTVDYAELTEARVAGGRTGEHVSPTSTRRTTSAASVSRNIRTVKLSDAPVRRPVSDVQVLAVDAHGSQRRPDRLATEEPMEIRVAGPAPGAGRRSRSRCAHPGNDFELAAGLCLTEGLIAGPDDLERHRVLPRARARAEFNVVTVRLRSPVAADVRERRYLSNSSCGICGKAALDEVEVRCAPVGAGPTVAASVARLAARTAREPPARLRPDRRAARGRAVPRRRHAACGRAKTSAGTTRSTS